MKFSKPEKITENGISYLVRTPEQVEKDLERLIKRYGRENDVSFKKNWRKLLSAKIPICPVCGQSGGPIRQTVEGEILGCDYCLNIAGYHHNLLGVAEVAEFLGWPKGKVSEYHRRGKLPKPVTELKMGPLWAQSQIEKYKENINKPQ